MRFRHWLGAISLGTASSLAAGPALAQDAMIRVYPGAAPGSETWQQQQAENNSNPWKTRIVYNVVNPTLALFKPAAGQANGTAIIICPGGGFHAHSIDAEGYEVARALAAQGVTAFVLTYRLIEVKGGDAVGELMKKPPALLNQQVAELLPLATADARNAVALVRQRAAEFGVNPARVGIIGFSAGGTVAASVAFGTAPESRVNFAAPIYPQYDWALKGPITADAPPLFLLAATDDQLGLAPHSLRMYSDWIAAKRPAELHLYSRGGHGFGMRHQGLPSDHWIERFTDWLGVQGLLKP